MVRPDLGPNCLPRLSADDTGRQRVKPSLIVCVIFQSISGITKLNQFQNYKKNSVTESSNSIYFLII